jgi:hydroxymethylpyrimidine/phosphomethylpyrimidine kinase
MPPATNKPVALTMAGSDPSGGAGIQADLKTFHQFGVYGEAVVTLITVQNTTGVQRVECLSADLVCDQIRAVIEDIPPQAAKIGALGNRAIVEAVARAASDFQFPLIVDPVMIAKNGTSLLDEDAVEALTKGLFQHIFLLTPNLEEAAVLTRSPVQDVSGMRAAAEKLAAMGPRAVLVKGGHLRNEPVDVLFHRGEWTEFAAPRIATSGAHGTGCTFSAAITALLARGCDLKDAIARAKRYITEAIRGKPELGSGSGPLDHHALV